MRNSFVQSARLAAPGDVSRSSWTPVIYMDDGSLPNLGSTGAASGQYTVKQGVCTFHGEIVWQGTGRTGGTANKQALITLPTPAVNPNTVSPITGDYFIGAGMFGGNFGARDVPGTLWIPPNVPTGSGLAAGSVCQLLIGRFLRSGTQSFVASTTLVIGHGLGKTPTNVMVGSSSQTTGLLTWTADATNITITAANSTSASIWWQAGFADDSSAMLGSNYPTVLGQNVDHIEIYGTYLIP
jgi:hypothetical protein